MAKKPASKTPPQEAPAHKAIRVHPMRMPPLGTLRAFESVARLRSVQRAAEELHVTPGAVSQQVKALEADLGVQLVRRRGNEIELTEQGVRGRDHLGAGLRLLQQGVERMRTRARPPRLRLTVEPAFASNWLIRRLPRYRTLPGAFDVLLDPAKEVVDIARGEADIAIRFGEGRYPGLESINLFEDEIFPVCSPSYLKLNPLKSPEELKDHHLLRFDWRASSLWPDWPEWLAAAGVLDPAEAEDVIEIERRSTVIPDSSLLLRAAIDGQGIALVPHFLAAPDIKSGRLVQPFAVDVMQPARWYLTCLKERADEPRIRRFREWLIDLVAEDPVLAPNRAAAE